MHKSEWLKYLFISIDAKHLRLWFKYKRDARDLMAELKRLQNLVNNFISLDFQTEVSLWFLFSMKLCIRIINKKAGTYCQRHLTNLLAKQPKTTTPRLHATYPLTLNCQTYLKKLLKRFYLASIPVKSLKIPAKFLRDSAEVLAL